MRLAACVRRTRANQGARSRPANAESSTRRLVVAGWWLFVGRSGVDHLRRRRARALEARRTPHRSAPRTSGGSRGRNRCFRHPGPKRLDSGESAPATRLCILVALAGRDGRRIGARPVAHASTKALLVELPLGPLRVFVTAEPAD